MASCFCTSCGSKMEYSFAAPNFCGKCGSKLNASAASPINASVPKVQKNISREDEDFDDEEEGGNGDFSNAREVPVIRSFAYEIEHELGNRTYKLGDLFGSPQPPDRKSRSVSLDDFKNRDGRSK